jgi:hypothetical protein
MTRAKHTPPVAFSVIIILPIFFYAMSWSSRQVKKLAHIFLPYVLSFPFH